MSAVEEILAALKQGHYHWHRPVG